MADSVPEVNPYEAERAARIAANQLKLQQLGLDTAVARFRSLTGGVEVPAHYGQPRKRQKKAQPQVATEVLEASRQSRRIRGAAALTSEDIKQLPEVQAASTQGSSALGCTRTGRPRSQLTVPPYPIVAPFTLRSIDVTVWELGSVYRGPWAQRYWSSSGCLFHHAYPVGYRASKVQFGRTFGMAIEAGPQGPIFKVTDQITGVTYSGTSPTKPWTDVCLAQRTGQRISGPLYFGFSDLVTQQAIAALYTPAELEAATQGERLGNAELTSEERAAKEFMEVDGIGETTAMVLALTFALGGRQHTTLQSLKGWAKEGDNAISLQHFLLHSPEMPEATRRWPAWRHRMVGGRKRQLTAKFAAFVSQGAQ
ncbi:hypothetical protein WJX72_009379 [[Myrmecia] bisecta]|uniref:Uncharacterized protein n=1 Tax=[Myrmecia] bisecta TaxID=41462 RepID=A0AAW1R8U1_9CHLO